MRLLQIVIFCLASLFFGDNGYSQIRPIKPFGKVSALIVGISHYQNSKIPQLEFAHRDAEAFAHYLEFETPWNVAPENIALLTNENATYGKFINELNALVDSSQPNDRLILYFSGHGDIEKVEEELMGYLLFYDASPTTYASGGACMVNTLNDYLEKLVLEKKTEVILISDACRAGTLAGSASGGPQATTSALSQLFNNTTKILSCESTQKSIEGPQWGGGRGLFSYYFLKGIKGMADRDQDRYVDLFEIERFVQDSVRKASNRKQLPVVKGLSSTRLARVDRKKSEPVPTPEPKETVASAPKDTGYLTQLALFEAALERKHLLFPEEGSANQIYESVGDEPAARSIKKVMKISLATALQDEAQQALNEYIVSPARELARRWSDVSVYDYYPDYLGRAAELLGPDNYFYNDIKSREHYFRGVNLRLRFDAEKDNKALLETAMTEQQQALKLQPIAPHIYNELGLLYKRTDQEMQAISAFQQALNYSPKWNLALTNLAIIYREMKQYAQAEKFYRDAIQLDTTFALSRYNLAVMFEQMEQPEKAKVELENTIRVDPKFAEAYYNLASLSLGDPTAEKYLLQYIQLEPDDPDGFNLLGYIYHSSDRFPEARQAYQSALMINPNSYYTLSSLAYVLKELGEFEAAVQLWNNYLQEHPDSGRAFFKLAGVHSRSGQQAAAMEAFRKALEKGYDNQNEVLKDPDLDGLRAMPEYKSLVEKYFPDKK
ncbi:tetratricopeptide repeat protein [Flavilitoribacter nigricans]|nr:tetratricopeptide repeat protein [Flavilitoribacter nigricans]